MARDDWFRRKTWSEADAESFFARLGRSRGDFHKSQYLRVQAYTLAETREELLVRVALDLLLKLFKEFPEPSQLASAHLQAAECYEQLGDIDKAMQHFRLSLDAQKAYPNSDPGTSLDYPWFIVMHGLKDHYEVALDTLGNASLTFPIQFFKASAIRAFIGQDRGDANAERHAADALFAAGLDHSGFRYHKDLGLVGQHFGPQIERLHKIAAA